MTKRMSLADLYNHTIDRFVECNKHTAHCSLLVDWSTDFDDLPGDWDDPAPQDLVDKYCGGICRKCDVQPIGESQ